MGVDCRGLLKGNVSFEEVGNVIAHKLGTLIDIEFLKPHEYTIKGEEYCTKYGYINFTYKGEDRSMMVSYSSYQGDFTECDEIDTAYEYTCVKLGYDHNAIEIMRLIIPEFGGYIDESDCDDIGYEFIKKNGDESIKPVIHIKLKDLYEKYGGIVVIDDYNS